MQDYKHIRYESERRKSEGKRSKKLSWIILLALILLIGAGIYLQKHPLVAQKIEKIVAEHKAVDVPVQKHFTFYDILAKGEVIVAADLPVQVKEDEIYIQLGAFKNDEEADNFQANLRLKGFSPQVQSLFLPDKTGGWFIVRLGRIQDEQDLATLKHQLEQNQIEYAIVSRKD